MKNSPIVIPNVEYSDPPVKEDSQTFKIKRVNKSRQQLNDSFFKKKIVKKDIELNLLSKSYKLDLQEKPSNLLAHKKTTIQRIKNSRSNSPETMPLIQKNFEKIIPF